MSTTNNKFDGDVAIGRDLRVGGSAKVNGSAVVTGGLKVKGWLDAVNVKGPNKGLYVSQANLNENYPNPQEGWWALVKDENSGDCLGRLYLAQGGVWVAQSDANGNPIYKGVPEVTSTGYEESLEGIQADIATIKTDVSTNKTDIDAVALQAGDNASDIKDLETKVQSNVDDLAELGNRVTYTEADIEETKTNIATNTENIATLNEDVSSNTDDIIALQGRVTTNETDIAAIKSGYAPLNENGKVESQYLPGYVDDVVEFATEKTSADVSSLLPSTDKTSTAENVQVLYLTDTNRFVLFVAQNEGLYYASWGDAETFGDADGLGVTPVAGKVYVCTATNKTYRWSGTQLTVIGTDLALGETEGTAFDGARGKAVETGLGETNARQTAMAIVPVTGIYTSGTTPTSGIWFHEAPPAGGIFEAYGGSTFAPFTEEDYNVVTTDNTYARTDRVFQCGTELYHVVDGKMQKLGGSNNVLNVTVEIPLISGEYYSDIVASEQEHDVLQAVYDAGLASLGLQITFAISAKTWKTYQYIGQSAIKSRFLDSENWLDLAGMSAGAESLINVNSMCEDKTYTLSTAIQALVDKETETGIVYRKGGLVLTFKTAGLDNSGNPIWESYQFTQSAADINSGDTKPWVEFGGSGSGNVTTVDVPAAGSKEAFSAGGAYNKIPTKLKIDTDTPGTVKISMQNEAGETVVEEEQFAVGTGSGGGSGTVVSVQFEQSPMYAKAGGSVVLKASIRSITTIGSVEQDNAITECVLKDRDTNQTLETYKTNQKSSASSDTFDFSFDVSEYFTTATSKKFQLTAYDDAGNSGSRNINVSGIDVTISSVQTLNYTTTTVLTEGGKSQSFPMYKFANNSSDKGILATTEIQLNGEWQTLGTATVNDTYSKSISIDPQNCLGETLKHGAYALRIHGEDIASGVVGNYLYTSIMVINTDENSADYSKPILVARWSDDSDGEKKLFEDVTMEFACYKQGVNSTTVKITCENTTSGVTDTLTEMEMYKNKTYSLTKRVVGYNNGDDLVFDAISGTSSLADKREVAVRGSLLDIEETAGALYKFDMEGRNNTDIDKTIKETATDDTVKEIVVTGANWSTNGFVEDTFGTSNSGGRMSLRIAENVTAECTDQPFSGQSINQNGLALSLSFKVKNIANRNARIIKCTSDKLGFVLTGEKFIVTTAGDSDEAIAAIATTAATSYLDDTVYRFDIVIEPESQAPYSGIQLCKVYQNGDMAACVPIDTTSGFPSFSDTIHFDGTDADLYLYGITRWNSYYGFMQAFNNYIVNLTDTTAMLTEYEQNQVMKSVTAEGTTKMRPDMQSLLDRGVMVVVETRTANANIDGYESDAENFYPDYIEDLKDKDTKVLMDLYLYFPDRPWANCKVEAVPGTNQGTSTLAYPIKNKKFKFKKAKGITMLYTRAEISDMYAADEAILAKYDDAAKLAKKNKIRVKEGSTPINTITIKVDYSDSAGANNCALMELMNDTQIKLGSNYKTPAQNFNTDTTEELHTSVDGVTCALYRTDWDQGQKYGVDYATNPGNAYFHSKGNFNADKGNPHFFGFEDVKGYNDGCVNYGDFTEIVTPRGTAIDDYVTTVLSNTATLTPGTLYMISEFCGPETRFIENDGTGSMTETTAVAEYETIDKTGAEIAADSVDNYDWGTVYLSSDGKYYQYTGGKWKNTTGSMTCDAGTKQWKIVGRVLNPVECYEYRQYQEFCWQQGVNSVDDMLVMSGDKPIWASYYESRYPDDDDLNALYESGKKVPYQLYRELAFCQQCNQNLTDNAEENGALNEDGTEKIFNGAGASTSIELDGTTVAGTKENRLLKWQREMHKYFSPYSTNCYIVASDYKATVDQRAKNMMIAVYKEADGSMRYYFNHWYDGDSVDEADNDCFLTIPWDMDGATSHKYQGWDGVMFKQTYALYEKGEGVWTGNTDSEGNPEQLTLGDTARAMRATKTDAGLEIFSPDGCYRYWMTNRILKWPKVVSSFDGERKYIETATASENRYPALHGLRLDSLPAFQRKRFAYRDGYYQTSGLYKHQFQARMVGVCTVTIAAAQDGFFAIGKDNSSSHVESCYLKEGESYTFATINCAEQGTLIYIFGSDKLGTLDLSGGTIKNNTNFSDCAMLKKLILGGTGYTMSASDEYLTTLSLDNNPFIEEIDVRNTALQSLNTTGCPRLKKVYAEGSKLTTFTPAEASPLETLCLPATLKTLLLKNLPKLSYPGRLSVEDMSSITSLVVDGCPLIDGLEILADVCAVATLKSVRVTGISTTKSPELLNKLKTAGTIGIDANGSVMDETGMCSGLTGKWILTELLEDEDINSLKNYYPELELHNSQFTTVVFDDTESDPRNITNLENGTTGETYEASGHILKIRSRMVPVWGSLNTETGVWEGTRMSNDTYTKYADGTTLNNADTSGDEDAMMRLPHCWYKGINDFKNEKKYICWSSLTSEPMSTATMVTRDTLSNLLHTEGKYADVQKVTAGTTTVDTDTIWVSNGNYNTYAINVEGMKQVRWPGVNSSRMGGLFVNAAGVVIEVFNFASSKTDIDFVEGEYIFTNVPENAVTFLFSSNSSNSALEAIAVDSSDIEAIEPDWVEHNPCLVGIYHISIDGLGYPRSVSKASVRTGTGTSTTSTEWTYDADGWPTGIASGTLNYTGKDFINLAACRGAGYQLIDLEMSKMLTILYYSLKGTRDAQAECGYGRGSGGTTGYSDSLGNTDSTVLNSIDGNKCLGIESLFGCTWEFMDMVGINITSYAEWRKLGQTDKNSKDPIDAKWHIYDPATKTERVVQGLSDSGKCILRVKHGRHCDIIASKLSSVTSDNTNFDVGYTDGMYYSGARGRVVGRSHNFASAHGGLAFADANGASSLSHSYYGSRLAFRGTISVKNDVG